MFDRIHKRRQRRQLAIGLRQVAQEKLAAKEITQAEHDHVVKLSRSKSSLDEALKQFEVNDDALGAIDWVAIKDWIIANWPLILRTVLSIAVLLLEPRDEQTPSSNHQSPEIPHTDCELGRPYCSYPDPVDTEPGAGRVS